MGNFQELRSFKKRPPKEKVSGREQVCGWKKVK